MSFRTLWVAFASVVLLSFAALGWTGVRIYQEAPPIPERVVTLDGREVIGPGDVQDGQNIWQAMGGMEVGSIWGHGSYVAPDWTADWLHREATFILDRWSGGPGSCWKWWSHSGCGTAGSCAAGRRTSLPSAATRMS